MGSMSLFYCLREVPSGWPLEVVIGAWVHLTAKDWPANVQHGKAALASRLEELWAEEGQEWLAGRGLSKGTREAQLAEVLLQHGLAEAQGCSVTHFTSEGLVRKSGYVPLKFRESFREVWLREGCRELAGRLAAAEAKAETAKRRRLEESSAELQAAMEASARRQELCEARVAELEAAASDKDAELQAVQEERGRLASRLEEVQDEVRALQSERAKREEQCQQLELQVHAAEAAASDQAAQRLAQDQPRNEGDLQSLLIENAVYKDRCEQLKQQLAKAEAEESAKASQIQALAEQKGLYMGRCNQLEQQLFEAKKATFPLSVGPQLHPTDERSSMCSEESWVHLSDPGSVGPVTQSSTSGISVDTSGPHCFMMDATFKAESGVMVSAEELEEGSKILAADGLVVQVASPPKQHQAFVSKSNYGLRL